jgi:ribosomal protein L37AE/L43A
MIDNVLFSVHVHEPTVCPHCNKTKTMMESATGGFVCRECGHEYKGGVSNRVMLYALGALLSVAGMIICVRQLICG